MLICSLLKFYLKIAKLGIWKIHAATSISWIARALSLILRNYVTWNSWWKNPDLEEEKKRQESYPKMVYQDKKEYLFGDKLSEGKLSIIYLYR